MSATIRPTGARRATGATRSNRRRDAACRRRHRASIAFGEASPIPFRRRSIHRRRPCRSSWLRNSATANGLSADPDIQERPAHDTAVTVPTGNGGSNVLRKSLCVLAFGAAVVAAAPAAACCGCASTCAPVSIHSYHRERIYRAYPQPIYVVNQGPVYSGPNIIALPRLGDEDIGPA